MKQSSSGLQWEEWLLPLEGHTLCLCCAVGKQPLAVQAATLPPSSHPPSKQPPSFHHWFFFLMGAKKVPLWREWPLGCLRIEKCWIYAVNFGSSWKGANVTGSPAATVGGKRWIWNSFSTVLLDPLGQIQFVCFFFKVSNFSKTQRSIFYHFSFQKHFEWTF